MRIEINPANNLPDVIKASVCKFTNILLKYLSLDKVTENLFLLIFYRTRNAK